MCLCNNNICIQYIQWNMRVNWFLCALMFYLFENFLQTKVNNSVPGTSICEPILINEGRLCNLVFDIEFSNYEF